MKILKTLHIIYFAVSFLSVTCFFSNTHIPHTSCVANDLILILYETMKAAVLELPTPNLSAGSPAQLPHLRATAAGAEQSRAEQSLLPALLQEEKGVELKPIQAVGNTKANILFMMTHNITIKCNHNNK